MRTADYQSIFQLHLPIFPSTSDTHQSNPHSTFLNALSDVSNMSAEHKYKFNVTMTCGGCSGAVERVLKKMDGETCILPPLTLNLLTIIAGVKSFDVSLDSQTADITTDESVDYTTLLEKIKKTGKKVNSGEADGVAQPV
jgi:copper chaperone